jgi:tetratricopeptide (TPR) repeat protein
LLAGACVLLSLIGGMVAAVIQARDAEKSRRIAVTRQDEAQRARQVAEQEHRRAQDERDVAVAARLVAQDRLTRMVDLSDRSLSDVYDLMERLAGGMPARKEMIATSLAFLEGISKEAGPDPRLRLALAKAYRRLGDIQSDPSSKSGGWNDALKSYRAASMLLEAVPQMNASGSENLHTWLEVQDKSGVALMEIGHLEEARALLRYAIDVVARLPLRPGGDKDIRHVQGCLYVSLSKALHPNLPASRPVCETSVKLLSELLNQYPSDTEIGYDLSRAYTERAYLDWNLSGPNSAVPDYERTVALREQLVKDRPNDVIYRRALVLADTHLASVQHSLGRVDVWRELYEKARKLAEVSTADPQNLLAAIDYATVLLDFSSGEPADQALADRRKALSLLEGAAGLGATVSYQLATAYNIIGFSSLEQKKPPEAIPYFRRALQTADSFLAEQPNHRDMVRQSLQAIRGMAESLTLAGDRGAALDQAEKMQPRIHQAAVHGILNSEVEYQSGEAYMTVANIYFAFHDWEPARSAAQNAIDHAMMAVTGRPGEPAFNTLRRAQDFVVKCNAKLSGNEPPR